MAKAQTHVKDLMKKDPVIISPDSTLAEAAQKMQSIDCGVLPVGSKDKLQGVITDRDIVIRAVAEGKDVTKEKVKDYMTPDVVTVKEDEPTDRAANLMRERNINRIIVNDTDGRPCGIITFGRMIRENDSMREIATVITCAVGEKAA